MAEEAKKRVINVFQKKIEETGKHQKIILVGFSSGRLGKRYV